MRERENCVCAAGTGCGSLCFSFERFRRRIRGRFFRREGENRRLGRGGFGRQFLDANDIGVRNYPAESALKTALFEALFEEDGAARVGDKHSRGGQTDIASSIMHFDFAPEKG